MSTTPPPKKPDVRVNSPERRQLEWRDFSLDGYVRQDDKVRIIWRYVESLDLTILYDKIQAVEFQPGRNAVDPKILVALWLMATVESISSARALERLSQRDLAYMWICGGVSVNYHLLSDFRSQHRDFLKQVLTTTVASLLHAEVITLDTVAQDGVRVRASAGSSSFHRKPTIEKRIAEAKAHLAALEEDEDSDDTSRGSSSAKERAVRDKLVRAEEALKQVAELQKEQDQRRRGKVETPKEARCSTTDPDARKMKMGDGGFRPAYNVQVATDGASRIIVGVDVTKKGNDGQEMFPMQSQIIANYGKAPQNYLVDNGFVTHDQITKTENAGSQVHAPVHGEKAMKKRGNDPFARKKCDTDECFAFRQRMATEAAQQRYKQRPSIAEYVNAEFRNRGLTQFRVRGLEKVQTVVEWYAITFNLLRLINLGLVT